MSTTLPEAAAQAATTSSTPAPLAPNTSVIDVSGLPEPVVRSIQQLVASVREGIGCVGAAACTR